MSDLKEKLIQGYDSAWSEHMNQAVCPPTPDSEAPSTTTTTGSRNKFDIYHEIAKAVSVNLAMGRCNITRALGDLLLDFLQQFSGAVRRRVSEIIDAKCQEPDGLRQIISLVHEIDRVAQQRYEELLGQVKAKDKALNIIHGAGVLNVWADA